ncbi:hypothetical protein PMAC_001513 [Pneumocystis sp. 'macacae']|nr:hypothetical protein PMAC_001513 [Pneumocystis sp. 'macacae']
MRRCLHGIWRRKEWNKRFFPACQGQRDECVHEVGRGERGRHLKMCTVLIRSGFRLELEGERIEGVRDDEASVCTKQLGRVGEVGCEKNVYRGDESVHQKERWDGGRRGVQEVDEVEVESRSNKIEEVEVEVEIRFRLALRVDECAPKVTRYEVCKRVGEVGCEKNVYRVDEVVCTKQLVGGGRGGEKWRWRVEEEYKKKRVEAELD